MIRRVDTPVTYQGQSTMITQDSQERNRETDGEQECRCRQEAEYADCAGKEDGAAPGD